MVLKPENGTVKRDFGYLFELHDLEAEVKQIEKELAAKQNRIAWLKTKIK